MIELHVLNGDHYTQIGNLSGITVWCEMCQEQTDHNSTWHLEREMDP